MKKLLIICFFIVMLASLVGCSNPPKSAVGDKGTIENIQINTSIYIPQEPNSDISGGYLFTYKGIVTNSYILSFNVNGGDSYLAFGTTFKEHVLLRDWWGSYGTAELEINLVTLNGVTSLNWQRIK